MLLTGKAKISIVEWRAGTVYRGFDDAVVALVSEGGGSGCPDGAGGASADAERIEWFWKVLKAMSEAERRNVLRFCTGTTRIPLDGFDPPFTLTKAGDGSPELLPTSHTCFNQLVLPCGIRTEERMREKLLYAASHGQQGFYMT